MFSPSAEVEPQASRPKTPKVAKCVCVFVVWSRTRLLLFDCQFRLIAAEKNGRMQGMTMMLQNNCFSMSYDLILRRPMHLTRLYPTH